MWRERAQQAHRGGPGYPSADELAERYVRQAGAGSADLAFYRALATLKLAVICEGALVRQRAESPERARRTAETVEALADLALDTVRTH
jgi:aminoglycoside phosphotransferase (APT) family kinase protein